MGVEVVGADLRANVLRGRVREALVRARSGAEAIGGHGGPVARALEVLDAGGWVSASAQRTAFAEELRGAAGALTRALESQVALCEAGLSREPEQVDRNDPDEGWKASHSRVDARAVRSHPGSGGW